MTAQEIVSFAQSKGFAVRLAGDSVAVVGNSIVPRELLSEIRENKIEVIDYLESVEVDLVNEDGFNCPRCDGNFLEVHAAGLVCVTCSKMAYISTPHSIVRVDYA